MEIIGILLGLIGPVLLILVLSGSPVNAWMKGLKYVSLVIGLLQLFTALIIVTATNPKSVGTDDIWMRVILLIIWSILNVLAYIKTRKSEYQ